MLTVYRRLLHLYPAGHREQFGDEMLAVFSDLEADDRTRAIPVRTTLALREVTGLIRGAFREHLRIMFGPDARFPSQPRSFVMRNGFRFPKSTVVFMVLILGGVLMAIKKGGDIARSLPDINPQIAPIQPSHGPLVPPVVLLWMFFCALGLVGWGIVFALKRSGMHRLAEMSGDRK